MSKRLLWNIPIGETKACTYMKAWGIIYMHMSGTDFFKSMFLSCAESCSQPGLSQSAPRIFFYILKWPKRATGSHGRSWYFFLVSECPAFKVSEDFFLSFAKSSSLKTKKNKPCHVDLKSCLFPFFHSFFESADSLLISNVLSSSSSCAPPPGDYLSLPNVSPLSHRLSLPGVFSLRLSLYSLPDCLVSSDCLPADLSLWILFSSV